MWRRWPWLWGEVLGPTWVHEVSHLNEQGYGFVYREGGAGESAGGTGEPAGGV